MKIKAVPIIGRHLRVSSLVVIQFIFPKPTVLVAFLMLVRFDKQGYQVGFGHLEKTLLLKHGI